MNVHLSMGQRAMLIIQNLVVKIDSVYQEYTLKELQKFQYRLSRALHVSPLALRLCQVEEGCLLLLFLVPSFVELEIFPLLYNWLAGYW